MTVSSTMSWCVSGDGISPLGPSAGGSTALWRCRAKGERAMMVEVTRWSLTELPWFVLTAVCAHLVMSGGQTLFHYGLGHRRLGGVFFRNHIRFHHRYYARGNLVSPTQPADDGNNTPYFL